MRLSPGYRFVPMDYELIKHHLLNKIATNQNLIPEIKDVELYRTDPQIFADAYPNLDNKWYFFSPRDRKYKNGKRPSRSTGTGYWKATGGENDVYGEGAEGVIGHKRTLVYYKGTSPKGVKTNWIMHEYWVDHPPRTRSHANDMKLDDWVLCRIYKKASRLGGYNQQQESNSAGLSNQVQESTSSGGGGRERAQASTSSGSGVARERDEEELDKYNIKPQEDWDDGGGVGREREQASTSSSSGVGRERDIYNINPLEDWDDGSGNYFSKLLNDNLLLPPDWL